MVTPEDAAAMVGIQTRVIYRWVEESKVHFVESDKGEIFVCFNSVAQCKEITD